MNDSDCLVKNSDLMISNNSESITIDSTESPHKSISDDDTDGDDDGKQQHSTLDQLNSLITINDINNDDILENEEFNNDDDDHHQVSQNIKAKTSRVSFPGDDNLITGYLEPANPWEEAHGVTLEGLLHAYEESCRKHGSTPLKNVINQLEKLDLTTNDDRHPELSLKNEELTKANSEPLEEIFRRLQFIKIDLESSGLDDESAETLFDIFEYYESAKHVNISHNGNIGARGWIACGLMIKRTLCLEQLDIRDIVLTQQHMNILKRPLQYAAHLQTLKLENCGLAGRAFVILAAALKVCTGLKELYLADNNLAKYDAVQLGGMLKINHHLQLLDVSNNNLQDGGVKEILKGLIAQAVEEHKEARGLGVLILWNNHFGHDSSDVFSDVLMHSKTLETLNIGQNAMGDEFLEVCKNSLRRNQTLLQLGVQSTGLISKGILALAEIIEKNETLERIDLRDNNLQLTGLTFLSLALKKNTSITRIDLDDKAISKIPAMAEQYIELINEIRGYCERNDDLYYQDESTSESTSPEHRSRVSSVSSRKISLTCQTLPARSPPLMGTTSEVIVGGTTTSRTSSSVPSTSASTMQMAKCTTGGRLRSPAPSPIPSPVASPIPSPSRNRFVVSRVSETSLSSNNSSASSSPVTPPPSFSSSPTISSSSPASSTSAPTCFFPADGSRFRVTIVTPALKINETEFTDSDDSDSVFVNQSSIRPDMISKTMIRPDVAEVKSLELNLTGGRPDSKDSKPDLPTVKSTLSSEIDGLPMDKLNLSTELRLDSETEVPDLSIDDSETAESVITIKSSFTAEIRPSFTTDIIRPTFKSEIVIPSVSSVNTESDLTTNLVTDSSIVEIRPDSSYIRPNVLNQSIESNSLNLPTQTDLRPDSELRLTETETEKSSLINHDLRLNLTAINLRSNLTETKVTPNIPSDDKEESRLPNKLDLDLSSNKNSVSSIPETSSFECKQSKSEIRPSVTSTEQSVVESRSQTQPSQSSSHTSSSLDRLLSLFQNPGSLFTTSAFEPSVRTYTSPFHHVSSMMSLGDKFQKYLREGLIDSDTNSTNSNSNEKSNHHNEYQKELSEPAFKSSNVPVVSVLKKTNDNYDNDHHDDDDCTLPMTLNVTNNCDNTNISINHPNLINNDNDNVNNDTHLMYNVTCDISVNNLLDDLTVDKDHNNDNILVDSNDLLHTGVEIIYEHCESFDDHDNARFIDKTDDDEASLSQNLLIDRSIDRSVAHRNSQDSGIEETNTCEDNPDGFAGSLDSGIESECSSVCVKTDEIVNDDSADNHNNDRDVNDDKTRLEEIKKKAFNIPVSNNDDDICSNS